MSALEIIGAVAGFIILVALILIGVAFIFTLAWNTVMPLFNLPQLELIHSIALILVLSIIFDIIKGKK